MERIWFMAPMTLMSVMRPMSHIGPGPSPGSFWVQDPRFRNVFVAISVSRRHQAYFVARVFDHSMVPWSVSLPLLLHLLLQAALLLLLTLAAQAELIGLLLVLLPQLS